MDQYIKKSDVVEEINKRIKGLKDCHADTVAGYAEEISGLKRLLSFINTFEVKEVDLDEEFDKCCKNWIFDDISEFIIAKHFFKLGYNHS